MSTLTCVSLFSGCGGLDLGAVGAGFKLVFATDIDKHCAESHARNFPKVPFHLGSIADIDAKLLGKFIKGRLRNSCDLLIGGPPCPPFSKSRFYRKEKPRALADPVGLESFNGYLRVLGILRPKAFLIENVPGLAYKVHRDALDVVLTQATALGYTCAYQVINAADYGVPQVRERFFIVGTRKRKPFTFPDPTHSVDPDGDLFSDPLKPWNTAGSAIGEFDTTQNEDDEGHFAGGQFHDLLRMVPPGDNYLFFTKERGHPQPRFRWRSRYWSFLLKLSPDRPSWTIQARRSNNMGPFHWKNRILRIEEIKRLQSFPDGWYLSGTIEQQWRQVGNAVPPLLAKTLAQAIRSQIEE